MVFTVENRKSKHHHCILHIRISWGTKFQLKLSKFVQFSGGVHFFCFRPGMPFRANFIPGLNWIFRFQWWCTLFLISNGNTLLGEFGQKIQNCQFKLKFGTLANSNMQNVMVVFTFSGFFYGKYHIWVNLVQKNQNGQFKLKFNT